jgi:amidase
MRGVGGHRLETQIWKWGAADLALAIRQRKVSAREALLSYFERLEDVNSWLNAIVDVPREEALSAAEAADMAVKRKASLGPLHGVPVTIKINVDYAGRATTNGVVAFKDVVAPADSAVVSNLRKAGAVIFGRTNVPCFSTRLFTDNDLYGRTFNPWDPGRTPGGSSGGAAAAVATGIGAVGHGNDRAGSIRFPAYACRVFGLRPSPGRIPEYNPTNREEQNLTSQLTNTQGPLTRSVSDARLALLAMAQEDHRDPWWLPPSDRPDASQPCRVALFTSMPEGKTDSVVVEAIRKVGRWLETTGYIVEEAVPPRFAEAAHLFWDLLMSEERAASENEMAASTKGIEMYGDEAVKRNRRGTLAYAKSLSYEEYIKGLARRTTILREWLVFLERFPVLVMPVSSQIPFVIDFDQLGDEIVHQTHLALQPSIAVSLMGLPALAAPVMIHEGIPIGVQVVAGRFQEERCFAVGELIERHSLVKTPINPVRTKVTHSQTALV